ncbi:MAG: hypothetical protein HY038_01505 [Nitrospirae bacterium]|nr:hypothetical protein [Nitrospirota bacterium]
MTPAQAAAALIETMPQPVSAAQLEQYGIEVPESSARQVAREILSLNLYWILAAIDAHIPFKYRTAIEEALFESIKTGWWESGRIGTGTWEEYQKELDGRRAEYRRLVDQEGMSHMAVSAEAASLIEDHGSVPSKDREKLLVLLIDYAPAAQYGKLFDEVG